MQNRSAFTAVTAGRSLAAAAAERSLTADGAAAGRSLTADGAAAGRSLTAAAAERSLTAAAAGLVFHRLWGRRRAVAHRRRRRAIVHCRRRRAGLSPSTGPPSGRSPPPPPRDRSLPPPPGWPLTVDGAAAAADRPLTAAAAWSGEQILLPHLSFEPEKQLMTRTLHSFGS
jgi:hypothetical protein